MSAARDRVEAALKTWIEPHLGTDLVTAGAVRSLEVEGSKLKLSITKALRSEERADLEAYVKSQPKQQGKTGFGTLADKFKNLKLS